ncbi:MAG: hypothetical protein QXW05_05535 [Ignisphaera sp.]
MSISTVIRQNIGARNTDHVHRIDLTATHIISLFILIGSITVYFSKNSLIAILTSEPKIMIETENIARIECLLKEI